MRIYRACFDPDEPVMTIHRALEHPRLQVKQAYNLHDSLKGIENSDKYHRSRP
jgi:hypothetical protein